MIILFYKYHGTGNDFILIDNRNPVTFSKNLIARLCNRRNGIGADGLILLNSSDHYDFGMTYFNADGNESTMCGNGGRCITAFARHLGIVKDNVHFSAVDGEHSADIIKSDEHISVVNLKMRDVEEVINAGGYMLVNTGSPHYVMFVDDINIPDLCGEARKIRYSNLFAKEGVNVNFVKIENDHLVVRTYERGVEDETLSCGTGVVAAALAVALKTTNHTNTYHIKTPGGDLQVSFHRDKNAFRDIQLEGPATFVFKGEININDL